MERREPLGIASGDLRRERIAPDVPDQEVVVPRKWRDPIRRIGLRRTTLAAAFLVAAVMVSVYIGSLAQRAAVSWLGAQPEYQVRFREIQLVPGLPAWYRWGTDAFLEGVRQTAGETETLSLLEFEPLRIKLSFERSPWVEQVDRVSYTGGIRVELHYRRPVALLEVAQSHHRYLLDERARILPLKDVDVDGLLRREAIIKIGGERLVDPADPRDGQVWKPGPGVHDLSDGNENIPEAARLAGFLVRKYRSLGPTHAPAVEIRWIVPTDKKHRGLFLWDAELLRPILWGKTAEDGPISPEERWKMLIAWSQGNPPRPDPGSGYWEFTRNGVRYHAFDPRIPQ